MKKENGDLPGFGMIPNKAISSFCLKKHYFLKVLSKEMNKYLSILRMGSEAASQDFPCDFLSDFLHQEQHCTLHNRNTDIPVQHGSLPLMMHHLHVALSGSAVES